MSSGNGDMLFDLVEPPQGATALQVLRDSAPAPFSLWRETDARSALTRGLREYIEQLVTSDFSGREIRFIRTYADWAEGEEIAEFPACIIHSFTEAAYDHSSFTPKTTRIASGYAYWTPSQVVLDLRVEAIATDNKERRQLTALLEDAFNPVGWMYGFRLDLPHYHNQRASFELNTNIYVDDEDSARQRERSVGLALTGRVPLIRVIDSQGQPVQIPLAEYRFDTTVSEDPSFDSETAVST